MEAVAEEYNCGAADNIFVCSKLLTATSAEPQNIMVCYTRRA